MAKPKYKLQTPGYIKDSAIVKALGFDKSNLSNAKAGRETLSEEKLKAMHSLIWAMKEELVEYLFYLENIAGIQNQKDLDYEKMKDYWNSISGSYEKNHKIID